MRLSMFIDFANSVFARAFKTRQNRAHRSGPIAILPSPAPSRPGAISPPIETDFSLFDLICIGVGATLGSGVFVLTGLVAHSYTGPGVVFAWLLAGLACSLSAISFAELSSRLPSAASSYSFVYASLGEWPAYLAAWCLTLECGISSAAVARAWGDKLSSIIFPNLIIDENEFSFNIFALLLQAAAVLIFLTGNDVSKTVVNIFTVGKMLLIVFMCVMGFYYFDSSNIVPVMPMGVNGLLRGAMSCFFGFVGYDEVCCMALESKEAQKIMPKAVFGTIMIVSVFYALSSLALVGMVPYPLIDPGSGFSMAFMTRHCSWAAQITAFGELVTLPLVVMASFIPQPRILYAMAKDGLASGVFKERDSRGVLANAIIFPGAACVLIAACMPFSVINDVVSAGVLLSFNLTNASLLIMRLDDPSDRPFPLFPLSACKLLLLIFHIVCIILSIYIAHEDSLNAQNMSPLPIISLAVIILISISFILCFRCADIDFIGLAEDSSKYFRAPGIPFLPLLGTTINYLLISQLSSKGMVLFFGYFGVATIAYIAQIAFFPSRLVSMDSRDGIAIQELLHSSSDNGRGKSSYQGYSTISIVDK